MVRWREWILGVAQTLLAVSGDVHTGGNPMQDLGASLSAVLKPGFHITPSSGWMNDPNGMFMGPDGAIHVSFQWNPRAPVPGNISWAHVMSHDMAHWERLPAVLNPDAAFDSSGVFSGSASIQPDGQPLYLFTGVSNYSSLGYYYQVQAMAIPANSSDPTFQSWIPSTNDMYLPEGGTHAQFRDPTQAWQVDGAFHSIVGAQVDCVGSTPLYSSPDLRSWTLQGTLASQVGLGLTNGTCAPAPTPQPGMGPCDQFGLDCHMWECPDFFNIGNAYVLKWSDQVTGRQPYSADWYVVSDQEPDLSDTEGLDSPAGVFRAEYHNQPSVPQRIDFGSIYASTTFSAGDRRLWAGWVYETSAGCSGSCSNGTPFTAGLGWQGVQTLLRDVRIDEASGSLLMLPVPELAALRQDQLFDGVVTDLQPAAAAEASTGLADMPSPVPADRSHRRLLSMGTSTGSLLQTRCKGLQECQLHCGPERQLEILANFTWPEQPGPINMGLVLDTGNGTSIAVGMNGTMQPQTPGGALVLMQAEVYVDRTLAGPMTNDTVEGGIIPLAPQGIAQDTLQLHVLIDRSIVEVFVLGGFGRVASRFYPTTESDWGLAVHGTGLLEVHMVIWSLENAFADIDADDPNAFVLPAAPP